MSNLLTRFVNIRNVVVKTLLTMVGFVLMVSQVYPFIMSGFLLTDKEVDWSWTPFLTGFALAVGAARYNTFLDTISNLFRNGKST